MTTRAIIHHTSAKAINEILDAENIACQVTPEKQLTGGNLKPDILIEIKNGDVYCLEPTWRTTGAEVQGELEKKQNTLSVGHIQKYLLDKVIDYVKELGMWARNQGRTTFSRQEW
ncbi:hypothetical protein [uncultured Thiodictyon sp.]|uniref:hypothetical protein n=1 Tax=uncultured Thiodictyon sp. TaxID=1846217 RepID=UPI0025D2D278|nr:hypothetical protein [uncultured Thiodictyon sp.]